MHLPIEILQEIYLYIPDDQLNKIMTINKKNYNSFNNYYWNKRSQKYFNDFSNHENPKYQYITNFINRFNKYALQYETNYVSFYTRHKYRDMVCINDVVIGILPDGILEIDYKQFRNFKYTTEDKYKYLSHFYCNICIAITENNDVNILYYDELNEISIKKTKLKFKKIEFNRHKLMAIDPDNNIWIGNVDSNYDKSIIRDTFSETEAKLWKCIARDTKFAYLADFDVYYANHENTLFKYKSGINYNMNVKAKSVYFHCYVLYIITLDNKFLYFDGTFKIVSYNVEQAYHMNDDRLIIIHLNEPHKKYINFKSFLQGQVSTRLII